jgi:hypothetical protein
VLVSIYDVARRQRAALLRGERAAASEMVRVYGQAWVRIRDQLNALTRAYYEARAAGEVVPAVWLVQTGRLTLLQQQVEREIARFATVAEASIRAQQLAAVDAAERHAWELIEAALGPGPAGVTLSFARLPREALYDLVGFTADGSPLRVLLDELGPAASRAIRDELLTGLALGQNALGGNMVRALRISRTEIMRAWREANHRQFRANSDVVKGWVWHSVLDARTCAMCWAMHGTVHRLDERLDDHVNGRCVALPRTRSWAELGFKGVPDNRPAIIMGAYRFAALDAAAQDTILGKAAGAAYRAGAVKLEDFIGRRRSRQWGTMRYARSLRAILGDEEARKWRDVA